MSLDILSLGPFVFDDFSVPEKMPFGGRQQMSIKKLPGGRRVIDCMGPDDIDRIWNGTLWGQDAVGDALLLDQLRRAGEPLPFSNGIEFQTVVILEFLPLVRKFTCVEYSIIVTPVDGGEGGVGGLIDVGISVGLDLAAAVGLL